MTTPSKEAPQMQEIGYAVHMFKEGKTYVAHASELDVSSCGATGEEARKNIRDAVDGFLETSRDLGTLGELLEEVGYGCEGNEWRSSFRMAG
jgi:predicted RNase H-like HicB family nuclease